MSKFRKILSEASKEYHVIIVWTAVFLFVFLSFLDDGLWFALMHSVILVGLMMLVSLIETRLLVKHFLMKGHHVLYYLLNVVFIILFSGILMMLQFETIDFVHDLSPALTKTVETNILLMVVIRILIFLIVISVSTITYLQKSEKENQRINNELKMESLDMELRYLKSQINPHFLFNALNNIYYLVYIHDEKAPDSVLKLSEMLRYVMVDCQTDTIPLEKEIKFIESYIDFQVMKLEENRDVTFEKNVANPMIMMPPMIFQPLVENSFKHSRIENDPDGFVHFSLKQDGNMIEFVAENSIKTVNNSLVKNSQKSDSLIGLQNVMKRLSLHYNDKFSFTTRNKDNKYTVIIKIYS